MHIEHRCFAIWLLSQTLLLADAHAQTVSTEKEEVRVEWDFSKRAPINSQPFARPPVDSAFFGATEPDGLKGFQDKDQADRSWTVQFSDGTVRRMLQRWADDAGYQLLWDVPRDYPIEVEMRLYGKFRDAVLAVARSLSLTDAPVQASINPDIRLIRVVRYLSGQAR